MRILFCNNDLKLGGAQRRLGQLIIGLDRQSDYELYVLLTDKDVAFKEVFNTKAKFIYLDKNVSRWTFFKQFTKVLKEVNPDVVHCWSMHQAYYLNLLAPFESFKYVCGTITTANTYSKKSSQYYVEKLSFLLSDIIVTNSMAGLKAKKAPMNKSRVIYNGYDFSRQQHLKEEVALKQELGIDRQSIVSMASRVAPQKDIDMLIKVATLLSEKRNDIIVLMLGDGPQVDYYRDLVKKRKLNNILFLGYRNDVESIIHVSSVCVLCSKHEEGVSNSIMESLADGKPVIATESGGTNEIIISGENGFIVKPGDAETMSDKIEFLVDNEEERLRMGKRAIEIINEKFLLTQMVEQYIGMYNEIIKS